MVWFTFTFLLGIPNVTERKKEEETKRKKENLPVEKKYLEIEVTKSNFACHIEYTLLPNEVSKFIDVICWDGAAKIYFESSTSALIPLTIKKLRWIHFRVNHKITLRNEDIPVFHLHNVKFTISIGNKKFGEAAKTDKPKKFFAPKFSDIENEHFIKKQLFQPLSETAEDLQSVSFFKEHLTSQQQLYISLDTTLETCENFNKLYTTLIDYSNEYHDESFIREPTPPFHQLPPLINILAQKGNDEAERKNNKRVDAKNKEPEKLEFSITGEEFLSGKKTFENSLKYNSEELPYIFCFAGVKNLLSKVQAKIYNPLSITLSHLKDLPVDQLENDGITRLKFRFLMCSHFLAESNLVPIKRNMKLKCTRTILTNTIDKQQLLYFIQTGGLKIDVLGSFSENKHDTKAQQNIQAEGFPNGRPNRSVIQDSTKKYKLNQFKLLGTVSVDLSSIILQPHKVHLKQNIENSNGGRTLFLSQDFMSTNEINSLKDKSLNLTHNLNASSSILTVTAGLAQPIAGIHQAITPSSQLFNRILVVFYNTNSAIPIIQMIQNEVDEYLGIVDYIKNGTNLRRPLTMYTVKNSTDLETLKKNKMTGFILDCVDKILIYAESSHFGGIQRIWASSSTVTPTQGHVLYDSELIFLNRLYQHFLQFGGFMAISLKQSPHVTLSQAGSYNKKNIPQSALEGLKCINSLVGCKSIKNVTKSNLFPDFQTLASVAMEFGAPFRICEKGERSL